jgi:hypothetical protein
MKTWIAILMIYAAPADAVNWEGPWTRSMVVSGKNFFATEAECRNDTISWIGRIHQDMLAPIRFQCVAFASSLPIGAAR